MSGIPLKVIRHAEKQEQIPTGVEDQLKRPQK